MPPNLATLHVEDIALEVLLSKQKKRNGVDTRCRVLKCFLHPRKDIADRYPNANAQARLDNLVAIRREAKIVNRAEK